VWFRSNTQAASLMPFIYLPFVINGVTSNQFIGIFGRDPYEQFSHVNTAGPLSYNQVEYTQIDGTLSHRFNSWLSARVLGGYWNRPQDQISPVNSGTNANAYNADTGVIQGTALPQITRNRGSQVNAQMDLLADFKTGNVGHKVLLTADYQQSNSYAGVRRTSLNQYALPLNNFLIGGPDSAPGFIYGDYRNPEWNVASSSTTNIQTTTGFLLSERIALLDNRWFIIVGGRHDKLERRQTDYLNPIQAATQRVNAGEEITYPVSEANTYQTGTLFRVTPGLSVYANYSSSFLPQGTGLTVVDATGAPLDPQKGDGGEVGMKTDLLNKKLTFTADVYSLYRSNIPRVARDPAGNPILIPGTTAGTTRQYSTVADVRSKGVEFDGNWQPTKSLSVTLGLGYNDIKYVKVPNATEQYLVGIPPDSSPHWTGGTTISYRFYDGVLKGLNFHTGIRYQGSSLINNSTSSIYGDSGIKGPPVTIGGVSYNTYYFKNGGFVLVNLGVGYRFKVGRLDQSAGLDISNTLDERYLRGARVGDPRSVTFSYSLKL
jgi:outer membrane receptor protein involved in Fe transport